MRSKNNEQLGKQALTLFTQVLLDHAATAAVDEPIDTRVVIEDYLLSLPSAEDDEMASRLRALAEAVRDIFLAGTDRD
ncbi:MAG: hypothetical protein JNM47_11850 [Hyphomonadaceae bacterium]|nr:hypothetical protein [Hyphomonadaceae bacterium]